MDDKEKELEGTELEPDKTERPEETRQPGPDDTRRAEEKKPEGEKPNEGKPEGEKAKGEKAKEEKAKASSSVLGNKTLEDVIRREAKEEQDTSSPFSLPKTLGGVMIARAFQKQIWLVLLVCAFFIIYINNRYVCQKRMVEIDKIERKMQEARYKATVCTSILTEKSRESNIMNLLNSYGDSMLTIPNEPPYLIRVDE